MDNEVWGSFSPFKFGPYEWTQSRKIRDDFEYGRVCMIGSFMNVTKAITFTV